jgi:hypothetical protein
LHRSYINDVERGVSLSPMALERIATAINAHGGRLLDKPAQNPTDH